MITNTWTQKGIATIALTSLLFPLFLFPQKAYAGVTPQPVVEIGPSLAHQLVTATQAIITGTHDTKDTLESFVLKPIALALGRAAIRSMTMSTVNWINGGFNGSPAFETDLQNSLRKLGDGVAQSYLTELANESAVHSPFIDGLITKVGAGYYLYSGRDQIKNQLRYTLAQSAADDKAFLAGDFNQGGWNAWFSAFMEPANNPYGAQMIASQQLATAISTKANTYTQELGWGSGFLSWKGDCIKAAPMSIAEQNAKGLTAEQMAEVPASLSDADGCLNRKTETPGSFFENKLNITTDSPLHQLELAQSIDAIVGALAQQLISKALGGGGLRSASEPSAGGGSSAVTQATGPNASDSLSASSGFSTAIATNVTQVTTWKTDSQRIETAANAAKTACTRNPEILASTVEPAIAKAQSASSRADSVLSKLSALSTQLQTAGGSNGAAQGSSYTQVASAYQQLVGSSSFPSSDEMMAASIDSKDSGDSTPSSLYTKLTYLAAHSCQPIGL